MEYDSALAARNQTQVLADLAEGLGVVEQLPTNAVVPENEYGVPTGFSASKQFPITFTMSRTYFPTIAARYLSVFWTFLNQLIRRSKPSRLAHFFPFDFSDAFSSDL